MLSEKCQAGYNGKGLGEAMLAVLTIREHLRGWGEVTQAFSLNSQEVEAGQ